MAEKPTYDELLKTIKGLQDDIDTRRSLIENSQDLFYRTDLEGRISYTSPSVYKLSGYTVEEALGMQMAEEIYLFPEERKNFIAKLQEEGQVANFEAQLKRKDGSIWWASTSARFYKDQKGNILGVEGITRDISALKSTENSLRASEERFRLAFHTSPDSINLNRVSDGMYIDINQGFTDLTGYTREDVMGKTSLEINIWQNPDDRKRLVDGLRKKGFIKNLEAQFVRKNGDIGVGLMSARMLVVNKEDIILSVTRDITEHKQAQGATEQLEKQLIQAQKLEAIGRLAGGVAHDLNNLLSPIIGYSELLLFDTNPMDPRKEKLENIIKAGKGAKNLVSQLLAFSRKQTLEYKSININETLAGFEKLLRRVIREDIEIHIIRSPQIRPIMADIGQLEQVIMNLAINAADAMPEGGTVIIETKPVELDDNYAKAGSNMKPGDYVMLAFSDTGYGMDEETRLQIFEPFFTTKGDQGTGLGLATVYGIVKQHGGNIWVYSEPGKGTAIKVYLPVSERNHLHKKIIPKKTRDLSGSETILLVEDNEQVRDIARSILGRFGYRILEAENGTEALKFSALPEESVDLLLTDVVMPDMNGKELFTQLIKEFPTLKVIYMSGYTDNVIVHHGVLDDGVQFIQKPFTTQSLVSKVREVMEG
jgi:two-component system, cell cycle sensor histidine kinase and response regulator CckA